MGSQTAESSSASAGAMSVAPVFEIGDSKHVVPHETVSLKTQSASVAHVVSATAMTACARWSASVKLCEQSTTPASVDVGALHTPSGAHDSPSPQSASS
jgi:hypothetical protein